MRSSETSGTPATTRKRARNQTSAAGSLSLLAVPRLKVSNQLPSPALELSGCAPPNKATNQPPERQILLSKSPNHPVRYPTAAAARGKENKPFTPAQASLVKLPVRHAAVRASRTPEKDSTTHDNMPVPCSSDRLSAALHPATNSSPAASRSVTAVDKQNARPGAIPAEYDQADCAGIAVCIEADQALMAQDVPLACHTAINKRRCDRECIFVLYCLFTWLQHKSKPPRAFGKHCRRPMGQATRYGEWYTGNDTDLDAQLLEYNAEQARAACEAGCQVERRKSDLASYGADKDDADFTDEEAVDAAQKRSSRLRRSTIAPGQVCFSFLL